MLNPGTRLGPYEIVGQIGAGGMGEVYRATDTHLGRQVAIKVLPEALAQDPERLARLEREARTLATLSHPHIATLHGVERAEGVYALVMELVDGPTLADRIAAGPLPLDDALTIAKQIADAVAAAHEQGIIHRDLKPANIKVRTDGSVKVLDFGLAKILDTASGSGLQTSGNVSASPTLTSPAMTQVGVILGTAAYMSPEQAKGQPADKRSDVWAFGCVLYEMLTGIRAFGADDVAETLAHVLTKEPDLSRVPVSVRRLLALCLKKKRGERLNDLGDAMLLVEQLATDPPIVTFASRWRWAAAVLAGIVAGVAVGLLVASRGRQPDPSSEPLVRLTVDLGADVSLGANSGTEVIISPDGTRIVYVSNGRLYTRRLDQDRAEELRGTERGFAPFFSPDGQSVGFFADRKLKTVTIDGGIVRTVCETGARPTTATWGQDGRIVAEMGIDNILSIVPAAGGKPQALTSLDKRRNDVSHRTPRFLPNGRSLLFAAARETNAGVTEIRAMALSDGRVTTLHEGIAPNFVPAPEGRGYLLYLRENTLFAEAFDPRTLAVLGKPVAMFDEVSLAFSEEAQLAVSTTGRAVYQTGGAGSQDLVLQWLTPTGLLPLLTKPGRYSRIQLSPDGQRLALQIGGAPRPDVWTLDIRNSALTRLTFNDGQLPQWSPDGRHIAYRTPTGLYWIRSDSGGAPLELAKGENMYPLTFTPDSRELLFQQTINGKNDIWSIPLPGNDQRVPAVSPKAVINGPFDERHAAVSRDGKWLAYASDETGEFQVYVRPYPDIQAGRWQVSRDGGGLYPTWSMTESKLFFRNNYNQVLFAEYQTQGGAFTSAQPQLWSDVKLADLGVAGSNNFDLAPDGRRVAALMPAVTAGRHTVVFLDHFVDELQRRVR